MNIGRSCWLHGHDVCVVGVGIVVDYTDTDKTTLALSENFQGFSKILKEQSGKKVIWVHLLVHTQ